MKVELQKANRLELPRYFPPGYFDRWFWLMVVVNTLAVGYVAFATWHLATAGAPAIGLFFQCLCLAACLLTSVRAVRQVMRHSREWRTEERPAIIARLDEMDSYLQRMANEFAEFLNSKSEGRK